MSLINVAKKMDIFEDIKGYEGLYQINRLGEIKSIGSGRNRKTGYILKQILLKFGYIQVAFRKDKKTTKHYIHRLLGIQFIPNPENKPTIDHIDRNKQNNSLENLRWATHSEQCNNQDRSAMVRGISKKELQKIKWTKQNDWRTISNQFRRILLE